MQRHIEPPKLRSHDLVRRLIREAFARHAPQSSLALIPGPPALVASSASSPGTNFRAGADFDAALFLDQHYALARALDEQLGARPAGERISPVAEVSTPYFE